MEDFKVNLGFICCLICSKWLTSVIFSSHCSILMGSKFVPTFLISHTFQCYDLRLTLCSSTKMLTLTFELLFDCCEKSQCFATNAVWAGRKPSWSLGQCRRLFCYGNVRPLVSLVNSLRTRVLMDTLVPVLTLDHATSTCPWWKGGK